MVTTLRKIEFFSLKVRRLNRALVINCKKASKFRFYCPYLVYTTVYNTERPV